jgi:hypothetical protein
MPVGWTQPIFQAIKMQMNNMMDNPTLRASAFIMLPDFFWSSLAFPCPRIMKYKAPARLATMAKNAKATNIFMEAIIR